MSVLIPPKMLTKSKKKGFNYFFEDYLNRKTVITQQKSNKHIIMGVAHDNQTFKDMIPNDFNRFLGSRIRTTRSESRGFSLEEVQTDLLCAQYKALTISRSLYPFYEVTLSILANACLIIVLSSKIVGRGCRIQ